MSDLASEVSALRTEVKYLKWIIPSACGLIALLFLIFWGIERKNIGEKVKSAIKEHGVQAALNETTKMIDKAKTNSKIISDKKDEVLDFVSRAETNSKNIADQKDKALRIVQEISENSVNIEKGAFGHWRSEKWITTLGQHGLAKLKVRKGDIIEVILIGSAEKSEFYYKIVEATGNAKEIGRSDQVVMNAGNRWRSITSSGLFRAISGSTLQFKAQFDKGDISGRVKVSGLVIIAKVIAK
jgi:hypothetical protein